MWVTGIPGKEKEREDISLCFIYFPRFREDFKMLFDESVIKRIAFDRYEWTKSKTSLAEYFLKLGGANGTIHHGFWDPIATVFRVNRRSLSKLASRLNAENARLKVPKESPDFKVIKELVERHRDEIRRQEEEAERLMIEQAKLQKDFQDIREIIEKSENADIETLRENKEKVKNILA